MLKILHVPALDRGERKGIELLLHANLRWWLVEHPTISNFQWAENQTWVSSPQFLLAALLSYLSLTFVLHLILPKTPTYSAPPPSSLPFVLHIISAVHNLFLLLISLAMAVGCSLSSSSHWFTGGGRSAMGGRSWSLEGAGLGRAGKMHGGTGEDSEEKSRGLGGVGGGDGQWDDERWLAAGWSLEGVPGRDSGWPMGGRWVMASWLVGKTKTQGVGASREGRRVGERRRERGG
ncbi:hypothetical protein ACLOJK_028788 [Asimina triloba]